MAKAPAKAGKKKTFKKKEKKVVSNGVVHVQASFNNTIVTFRSDIRIETKDGKSAGKSWKEKDLQEERKEGGVQWSGPCAGLLQQHYRDVHRSGRQRPGVVELRFARIPRVAQGNTIRRPAGVAHGRQQGQGIRFACRRSARQRAGRGS